MLTHEQYEKKWNEIKGGLRILWGQLSDEEIEAVRGDLYGITELVETRHHESRDEIRKKIDRLMDSFENDTDRDRDPDVSSYERRP